MQTRLRRTTLVPAIAVLVALAAVPASAGGSSNTQLAEEGVIVAGDVPSSWQSTPDDDSSDKELDRAAAKIADCKKYVAVRTINKRTPSAESRDFSDGSNSLSNEVWVYASAAKAKKVFANMRASTIEDCFTTLFQGLVDDQIAGDNTVRNARVVVQQTTDFPTVGDESIGYAGNAQYAMTDGSTEVILLANLGVRVGRSIITYSFSGPATSTGFSTPFATGVDGAISASVTRMEDALS